LNPDWPLHFLIGGCDVRCPREVSVSGVLAEAAQRPTSDRLLQASTEPGRRPPKARANAATRLSFENFVLHETLVCDWGWWHQTTSALAKRFGVAPSTVSRWRKTLEASGEIRTKKVGGRVYMRADPDMRIRFDTVRKRAPHFRGVDGPGKKVRDSYAPF